MPVQALAQVAEFGLARRLARGNRDIDRWQRMLIQSEGLARQAFDAIACHRGAEYSCRDAQTQSRMGCTVGQNRQTEIDIGEFPAATLQVSKFGRRMQSLARLEREFTDRDSPEDLGLRTEALAALGAAAGEQAAAALRGHARAKTVGAGSM